MTTASATGLSHHPLLPEVVASLRQQQVTLVPLCHSILLHQLTNITIFVLLANER
jgi:hypothetical protein